MNALDISYLVLFSIIALGCIVIELYDPAYDMVLRYKKRRAGRGK